jgi:hypothetical protein
MPRFTCVREPDGTWRVWDREKEAPATLAGKTLTGMNKYHAEAACGVLERIHVADHKRIGR